MPLQRKIVISRSIIVGTIAIGLSLVMGVAIADAQGRGGGHGGGLGGPPSFAAAPGSNQGGELRGLNRADVAGGTHGARGRAIARKHGANKTGFCPPGQAKKSGLGSRFQC